MKSIDRLLEARDLSDLAELLGYPARTLSFILYVIPDAEKYKTFTIPKKNWRRTGDQSTHTAVEGAAAPTGGPPSRPFRGTLRGGRWKTRFVSRVQKAAFNHYECEQTSKEAICVQYRPRRFLPLHQLRKGARIFYQQQGFSAPPKSGDRHRPDSLPRQ